MESVPEKLLMLANMKPEIRRQVTQRIDVRGLYQKSAESGQPVAMREVAKLMAQRRQGQQVDPRLFRLVEEGGGSR